MAAHPSEQKVIWLDGQFVPWKQANMHVLSHHYGIGVFEGVRSYACKNLVNIFRLHAHTNRLFRSAHILNMNIPYSKDLLNQVQCELIQKNQLTNAYLRPLVFYGGEYLGLTTDKLSTHVMVAAIPWQGAYPNTEKLTDGIKVHTASLSRHHINSVFTKAKASGNYMNSILALQEARLCGADEALLLDHQGCVAEGSGANIFIIRDSIIYTPDLSAILEGITRSTLITLAQELGFTIAERRITRDEVYIADEAFLTGTAVEITPIREIDGRIIGNGKTGLITHQLQQAYQAAVRGENKTHQDWVTTLPIGFQGDNYENRASNPSLSKRYTNN